MTRLHPAISLDRLSGNDDGPRRRKPTKRERRLARLRREQADLRARLDDDREPALEPLTGAVARAPDPWGPAVRMGRNLRVQAAVGHRAAVIELKPGLFLVAEMPEAALRPEFGFLPMLAPMIIKAASQTIGPIVEAANAAKQHRQERGQAPVRMFPARQHGAVHPAAQPAPLALPGPVAAPQTAGTVYLPTPNVGWADDELVADVMGCDACGGRCGR